MQTCACTHFPISDPLFTYALIPDFFFWPINSRKKALTNSTHFYIFFSLSLLRKSQVNGKKWQESLWTWLVQIHTSLHNNVSSHYFVVAFPHLVSSVPIYSLRISCYVLPQVNILFSQGFPVRGCSMIPLAERIKLSTFSLRLISRIISEQLQVQLFSRLTFYEYKRQNWK